MVKGVDLVSERGTNKITKSGSQLVAKCHDADEILEVYSRESGKGGEVRIKSILRVVARHFLARLPDGFAGDAQCWASWRASLQLQ